MVGEGESERQEAISAAAELGIHGLVEVPRSCRRGQQVEAGVQTEPSPPRERGGRGGWRREVRDGCTLLWRDAASGGKRDTWTQTEEKHVNVAPPPEPSTSFETIDMTSFQSLAQTPHSSLLPEQIPYIPLSVFYTPEEHQTHQLSSAPGHFLQESTVSGHRSASVLAAPPTLLPPLPPLLPLPPLPPLSPLSPLPSQEAPKDVAPAEQWDSSQLEEFQGNIPGYINYFLNAPQKVDLKKKSRRGRPRGRRRAAGGGARTAGAPERGTCIPRGGRRGRGGLTQTVDVQDVGVSKLHKLFLQRWSTRPSRTGQGGGAVGRKLCLKSREVLKSARSRRAEGKMWTFCPSRDGPPYKQDVSAGTSYTRRNTTKPTNQVRKLLGLPNDTKWMVSLVKKCFKFRNAVAYFSFLCV